MGKFHGFWSSFLHYWSWSQYILTRFFVFHLGSPPNLAKDVCFNYRFFPNGCYLFLITILLRELLNFLRNLRRKCCIQPFLYLILHLITLNGPLLWRKRLLSYVNNFSIFIGCPTGISAMFLNSSYFIHLRGINSFHFVFIDFSIYELCHATLSKFLKSIESFTLIFQISQTLKNVTFSARNFEINFGGIICSQSKYIHGWIITRFCGKTIG